MAKKPLTDRKVKSLKAAAKGKRYQVMDALVPGFGVRVTDKRVKTYIFQARFPGSANPARREINEATLEKAREKARHWAALVRQGVDPAQVEEKAKEEQAQVRANTFGAIAKDYLNASWPSSARARPCASGSRSTCCRSSRTSRWPKSPIWTSSARS